mmetsp:Transcript_10814/g.12370  ORF Transcript_10814/g.12370 Transcript_10814/m.12370 type:complete len:203 (-) Transcript_10814:203-811(-)
MSIMEELLQVFPVDPRARVSLVRLLLVVFLSFGVGAQIIELRMDSWYWNTFPSTEEREKAISIAKVLYGHYGESEQNFVPKVTDVFFTIIILCMCSLFYGQYVCGSKKWTTVSLIVDIVGALQLGYGFIIFYFVKEPAQNYFARSPHWKSEDLDLQHLKELVRFHQTSIALLSVGTILNSVTLSLEILKSYKAKTIKRQKSR